MIYLITPETYDVYKDKLNMIYESRLSKSFFWNCNLGLDYSVPKDHCDQKNAYYLYYEDKQGLIQASLRFIEMIHPCLIESQFEDNWVNDFKLPHYWELAHCCIRNQGISDEEIMHISNHLYAAYVYYFLTIKKNEYTIFYPYHGTPRFYFELGLIVGQLFYSRPNLIREGHHFVFGFPCVSYSLNKMVNKIGIKPEKLIGNI